MSGMGRVERRRMMGAQTFTMQTPSCPPGQHWEDDSAGPIRGLAACVADRRVLLHYPGASPAPANTQAPVAMAPPPPASAPAPTFVDMPVRAPAPAPEPCPDLWPWWWLLVAAAAGGAAGYYAGKNPKKTKQNAGVIANAVGGRIVNRVSNAAAARFF